MMMLAEYISQIVQDSPGCTLLSDSRRQDDLSETAQQIRLWQFSDGVVLRCCEEIETQVYDNDCQCPERWIVWDVVAPGGKTVSPARKEFFSLCQQRFWLKMQAADNERTS